MDNNYPAKFHFSPMSQSDFAVMAIHGKIGALLKEIYTDTNLLNVGKPQVVQLYFPVNSCRISCCLSELLFFSFLPHLAQRWYITL
jgi:hypothetical protein